MRRENVQTLATKLSPSPQASPRIVRRFLATFQSPVCFHESRITLGPLTKANLLWYSRSTKVGGNCGGE